MTNGVILSLDRFTPTHQSWLKANPNLPIWLDITIGVWAEYVSGLGNVDLHSLYLSISDDQKLTQILNLLEESANKIRDFDWHQNPNVNARSGRVMRKLY